MNQTETIRSEAAQLLHEYEVPDTTEPIHGATFDARRLVVARGARLLRLVGKSGRPFEELETFPSPGGLAYDGRYLWQHSQGRLQQLEVRTGLVVRSVRLALEDITGLECLDDDLLVLHAGGRALTRVETVDHAGWVEGNVVAEVETGAPLRGLAWTRGELWTSTPGALLVIEPASGRMLRRLSLPGGAQVLDLAGDVDGRLWCVGDGATLRVFAGSGWRDWREPVRPRRLTVEERRASPPSKPAKAESPAIVADATFDRILVPVDFSEASKQALATALLLKESMGSEVHLFHLADHGANDEFLAGIGGRSVPPGELVETARTRLRQYVENLYPDDAPGLRFHAHFGSDVVQGIERVVREVGATLVLLTERFGQPILRTHVEKITRDVDATVMVLRARRQGDGAAPS